MRRRFLGGIEGSEVKVDLEWWQVGELLEARQELKDLRGAALISPLGQVRFIFEGS